MVWSARHQCLALAWAKLSRLTPCRYVVSWTIVHLVLYTQWYAILVMYEWCVYTYYYLDHAHIGNDKRQQTIFAPRKWHLFCHEVRRFSRYHPGKCPQTRWTWMFLALGTDGHPLQSWNNCPALMPALYRLLVNIRMFRDPGTHFWGMLSSWSVPKHNGNSTASGSLITDEHPRRFWRWEEETKVLSIFWFKHVEMVYLDLNLILWGPNIRGLVPHHIKPSQPALEATRTTPGVNLAQLSCGSGHFLNAAGWL